ncbi:MAG: hypothetical protein BGO54_22995 [Sphingobacteriales bacterium 46-32]|nr:MAG: hypothetical protein BGO54_22995 [Sphingobacteriales bacterium 46-32]
MIINLLKTKKINTDCTLFCGEYRIPRYRDEVSGRGIGTKYRDEVSGRSIGTKYRDEASGEPVTACIPPAAGSALPTALQTKKGYNWCILFCGEYRIPKYRENR